MVHLRYFHEDGRPRKDWIIQATPEGLLIQYGPSGKKLRSTTVPSNKCQGGVHAEMQKRITAQLKQGYREVTDPNDPEMAKALAAFKKEQKAKEKAEAMEKMGQIKTSTEEAKPHVWF